MDIKIHNVGGYVVKNYLLETSLGIIAIDTGYPGGCGKFVHRFEKIAPLDKLKYIFLTHHHDDHAGFLADLLPLCDVKVILHPLAVGLLKQGKNYASPQGGYSSIPASWFGKFKTEFVFPPVDLGVQALTVEDETHQLFEQMGLPIKILFLPGHTADSIGLFLPTTGQLFCGDAAMNAVISVAKHTIWIDNVNDFAHSWDKMLALNPKKIYPSHGTPFSPQALKKHRNYLNSKTLIQMD